MLISFINDVNIQLSLELKIRFGKYHPVFLKISLNVFGTSSIISNLEVSKVFVIELDH